MTDRYDEEKFLGYLEGDLPPEEVAAFEKQFAEDARLRNLVAQLVIDRNHLRQLPQEKAPPELMERVNINLERSMLLDEPAPESGSAAPVSRWTVGRIAAYSGLAAMIVLCAGILASTLLNQDLLRLADHKSGRPRSDGPTLVMKESESGTRGKAAVERNAAERDAAGVSEPGVDSAAVMEGQSLAAGGTALADASDAARRGGRAGDGTKDESAEQQLAKVDADAEAGAAANQAVPPVAMARAPSTSVPSSPEAAVAAPAASPKREGQRDRISAPLAEQATPMTPTAGGPAVPSTRSAFTAAPPSATTPAAAPVVKSLPRRFDQLARREVPPIPMEEDFEAARPMDVQLEVIATVASDVRRDLAQWASEHDAEVVTPQRAGGAAAAIDARAGVNAALAISVTRRQIPELIKFLESRQHTVLLLAQPPPETGPVHASLNGERQQLAASADDAAAKTEAEAPKPVADQPDADKPAADQPLAARAEEPVAPADGHALAPSLDAPMFNSDARVVLPVIVHELLPPPTRTPR